MLHPKVFCFSTDDIANVQPFDTLGMREIKGPRKVNIHAIIGKKTVFFLFFFYRYADSLCLSCWFTGRFNHPAPYDSTPSSRLWCLPTQCAARPFHSYLGCPHCALRCCIAPVSMPGHWGSTPCCCQSWTDRGYSDLAMIAVTPIYQTRDPRQYEAVARVFVFVGWPLRVIRPLADLGSPRQGQAAMYPIYETTILYT